MNRHFHFCHIITHFILCDGSTISFWAPKYLSYALALDFKGRDLQALLEVWERFLKYLAIYNDIPSLDADDMNSCVESIISSGKSLNDFLSPYHLAADGLSTLSCKVSIRFLFHSRRLHN